MMADLWQYPITANFTITLRLQAPEDHHLLRCRQMSQEEHILEALLMMNETQRALCLRTILAKKLAILDEATWLELLTGQTTVSDDLCSSMISTVHEELEAITDRFLVEWQQMIVQDE
jgi:hypothetical protein